VTGRAVAIVVAAGSGERLGADVPKAFVRLGDVPLLLWAVRAALASPVIASVIVAAPAGREDLAHAMIERAGSHTVITGGASRQASVRAALDVVPIDVELVAVHDAARPLATSALFSVAVEALADADGAVPVVPLADTVKQVRDGWVVATAAREELAAAQTPQAFRAAALRDALTRAAAERLDFTDDAGALEWAGYRVRAVDGEPGNFKVTTPADLERADELVRSGAPG
jgi:2-C-methyl-D-erythritol 4-phosphate cytidylyltransferase/2-C-methyl-D-erythritol 2,4-cyclodiphosphate synthase